MVEADKDAEEGGGSLPPVRLPSSSSKFEEQRERVRRSDLLGFERERRVYRIGNALHIASCQSQRGLFFCTAFAVYVFLQTPKPTENRVSVYEILLFQEYFPLFS